MSAWFKKIIGISILTSLFAGGFWVFHLLADPALFPIKVVKVEGEVRNVNQSMLAHVLEKELNQSFFFLNVQDVQEKVRSVPWVEGVVVQRIWPHTVKLDITEQVPVAIWNSNELISRQGQRFEENDLLRFASLPVLKAGKGFEQQVVDKYFKLKRMLDTEGMNIRELALDERLTWSVTLQNGIRMRLAKNTEDGLIEKFVRAYQLHQISDRELISIVDMRYRNGFSVRWAVSGA
jgi:cell division protein FtsQ